MYPPPPYHYDDAKIFLALFYSNEDSLSKILPDPLRPTDMYLAGVMFGEQPCRETSTFHESAILVQALYEDENTGEEEVGVYFAFNWCDSDIALAAGREIWGYPRKMADIQMKWKDETLTCETVRNGDTLLKTTCTFEDEGEWIDSGANLNVRRIPSSTGEDYVVSEITAANLQYDIKTGRSGEVDIEIQAGPHDNLKGIKIEGTMIGLVFDTDILLPPPRKVLSL
jgi:hypothetical protein